MTVCACLVRSMNSIRSDKLRCFPLARNDYARVRHNQIGQKCLNCHSADFFLFSIFYYVLPSSTYACVVGSDL